MDDVVVVPVPRRRADVDEGAVGGCHDTLRGVEIDGSAAEKLATFLDDGNRQATALETRTREAAHAVAGMPLFQLA